MAAVSPNGNEEKVLMQKCGGGGVVEVGFIALFFYFFKTKSCFEGRVENQHLL